jgi:hypothetical protein
MQSWADCITGTHESSFWKQQQRKERRDCCVRAFNRLPVFLRKFIQCCFNRGGVEAERPGSSAAAGLVGDYFISARNTPVCLRLRTWIVQVT